MGKEPEIPGALRELVAAVGAPVTTSDVDTYARLRSVQDQSHRIRTIVDAWKLQQDQERKMRERYATVLIVAMIAQVVAINCIFVQIGRGKLSYEPWTAKVFIMAVFTQLAAMVLFIVKYLFRPSSDEVLELTMERRNRARTTRTRAKKKVPSAD